ncbi:DUF4197 domain-containing protein [Empedobacter stercoris]|uniref:DUF4197 domain-containing protein n=1 Tax=Empedobacter stercoris TaxID=1628248 RepID=UPI0021AF560D|nr:DUF4197 domain-containing protein [Empedobacter stercoris]UWX67004.1 DUF4197 domain-containing protein [Empedobacter stercoris]
MPEELQNVEKTLRSLGMGSLADKGIKLLNSAAEDAVSEAAPIFVNALTSMTITDAKDILLGGNNSATNYLKLKTNTDLTNAFQPKVEASLGKVGADKVWNNLITKYNTLTGNEIEPNLNAYVTQQTLNGVFNMVAEKENEIRNNSALQTTSILQQVFGSLSKKITHKKIATICSDFFVCYCINKCFYKFKNNNFIKNVELHKTPQYFEKKS